MCHWFNSADAHDVSEDLEQNDSLSQYAFYLRWSPLSWLVFGTNGLTKNTVNNSKNDQTGQLIGKPTEWTAP